MPGRREGAAAAFNPAVPIDLVQHGTAERAWRLLQVFKSVWGRVNHTAADLVKILDDLEAERVYDLWPPEHPFGSMDALTEAVIGKSLAEIDAHIVERTAADRRIAAAQATTGARRGKGRPPKENAQIVHLQARRADASGIHRNSQRKLDRLARDFPLLADAVRAGRLSVNRAAIEAGFVHPTAPIRTDDVAAAVRTLLKHFSAADVVDAVLRSEGHGDVTDTFPPPNGYGDDNGG